MIGKNKGKKAVNREVDEVEGATGGGGGLVDVPTGWSYEQYAEYAAREREEAAKVRAHELQMAQLRVERNRRPSSDSESDDGRKGRKPFNVTDACKRVPKFNEHDVESSIVCFEKFALAASWPKEHWSAILIPNLTGKALKAFNRLDQYELNDYNALKNAILTEYELVSEVYRKRFRTCVKRVSDSYSEFMEFLSMNFVRWTKAIDAADQVDKLTEAMIIEQFLERIPDELRTYLMDKNLTTTKDVAKKADEYVSLHKSMRNAPTKSPVVTTAKIGYRQGGKNNGNGHAIQKGQSGQSYNLRNVSYKPKDKAHILCYYCHKPGHKSVDCDVRKRENSSHISFVKSVCENSFRAISECISLPKNIITNMGAKPRSNPYILPVRVFNQSNNDSVVIYAFRDTGADVCVLLEDVVPREYLTPVNKNISLNGFAGYTLEAPLFRLTVDCTQMKGVITAALIPSVYSLRDNACMLIGNDYGRVVNIAFETGDSGNVLVTTRSQAAKQNETSEPCDRVVGESKVVPSQADLPGELTGLEGQVVCPGSDAHAVDASDFSVGLNLLFNDINDNSVDKAVTVNELCSMQHNDVTLKHLFENLNQSQNYFIHTNGLLVRKFLDVKRVPDGDNMCMQIVIPYDLRSKILQLSHSTPSSCHLGQAKTQKRILKFFFWPGVFNDIKNYCRSCDTCQRANKTGKVAKVPMQSPPIIDKPFSRLSVDIVGPLMTTTKGNRFILTIVDHSTRWAEAYPLPNHQASTVCKALMDYISRYGVPEEILHDLGADFTSELFQVVLNFFGVNLLRCSVGHPQTNTVVEKFNGTLKSMLKTYLHQFKGEWDDAICFVLLAYRELQVAEYGYSPFELVFGRFVKGPLSMLYTSWWEAGEHQASPHVLDYMLELREHLQSARLVVQEQQHRAQDKAKTWYDKNARAIEYGEGELVLVLRSQPTKPLCMKYEGPYKILKKVSPVDYLVSFPGKRKHERVLHVNMLKKYIERTDFINIVTIECEDESDMLGINEIVSKVDNNKEKHVDEQMLEKKLEHLNLSQKDEIRKLVSEFSSVINDRPGCCINYTYNINVKDNAKPVHQNPYRMSPPQQQWLRTEIEQLLAEDLIEPSNCEWASPVVLVAKEPGNYRCCIDFKKVNKVIEGDTFPMPRIDDLLDRIGQSEYLTKLDLSKGFYQILLNESSRPITTFCTPFGTWRWKRVPFGLKTSPACFNKMLYNVFSGLEDFCGIYLDDIVIYSKTFEEHVQHCRIVLERLKKACLTVKLVKCYFACKQIEYLGHKVGLGEIRPKEQKVKDLLQTDRPVGKRQLQSFLGAAGYYRRFIPNFSDITAPLTSMLCKGRKYLWTREAEASFQEVKNFLSVTPVLLIADFTKPFYVFVDASAIAVGAVLMQKGNDELYHPVSFFSKKLNSAQQNYGTTDREALALILAVRAFKIYLTGKTVVYTDHEALRYINNNASKNQRLLRWSLELQQYDLVIEHVKGTDNQLADFLSRPIKRENENECVN